VYLRSQKRKFLVVEGKVKKLEHPIVDPSGGFSTMLLQSTILKLGVVIKGKIIEN